MSAIESGVPWTIGIDQNTIDLSAWNAAQEAEAEQGASADSIVAVSSNYTIVSDIRYVRATGGVSGITVTLPAAVAGRRIEVKKIDAGAGAVTVAGTIDGGTNHVITTQFDAFTFVGNGTSYEIF